MVNLELLTRDIAVIARRAGAFLRSERDSIRDDQIDVKGQGDFASRADRHAEEMLREALTQLVPGSVFMGEEFSPEARGGEWRWIVDPLDGTSNYLMGLPVYAVSIALEDRRGNPEGFGPRVVAVIYLPALDVLYEAYAGGGTRRNGKLVRVRGTRDMKRAVLATGFPFRNREDLDGYLGIFRGLYPEIADLRRIGSAAADLAWVADGTFDGYFEMDLKPWDLAAGGLMIEEAGGVITDWWDGDVLSTGWVVCGSRKAYTFQKHEIDRAGFTPPDRLWR